MTGTWNVVKPAPHYGLRVNALLVLNTELEPSLYTVEGSNLTDAQIRKLEADGVLIRCNITAQG